MRWAARKDLVATAMLLALWLVFFWRLFTPVAADQASLRQGDFSGQFVAFGAYQYQRMSQGEIPLWNPWNNGGMPFLADPQTAVFYPPRLLTIALSGLAGGWSYYSLELEMAVHVLAFTLMMYLLLRRMTRHLTGSVAGALLAAIVSGYGGWTSGYPPLQLAILESGIWLPIALLGVYEATEARPTRWRWLFLSGLALGLSWLAGHSQTSWQLSMVLVAWIAWRAWEKRLRWHGFLRMTGTVALLAFGLAAVQLLPGIEYLLHTSRAELGYDAKGNGFPVRDLLQYLFPAQLSLFSPLYIGIAGLVLVLVALQQNLSTVRFWLLTALVALTLSLGKNAALFPALYNLLPGLRWFRGQERAAYLVSHSLAIAAGLTLAQLGGSANSTARWHGARRILSVILLSSVLVMALAPGGWPDVETPDMLGAALFTVLLAAGIWLTLRRVILRPAAPVWSWLLLTLLVFDLFTVNMDATGTWEGVTPEQQLSMAPPPLVAVALQDQDGPFRVDGLRGLHDNFGSLFQLADMRGISPLFLTGPWALIGHEAINPRAWELFAVRYVYSDWRELPVPAQPVMEGKDRYGAITLHRLDDPRPWAHLLSQVEIVASDEAAYNRLADPAFAARQTVLLDKSPLPLPDEQASGSTATITSFSPELIEIEVDTPGATVLSLAHPHYPGWAVFVNGKPAELLRAYGALSAVTLPAGQHVIELTYNPLSWRLGAFFSLATLLVFMFSILHLRRGKG